VTARTKEAGEPTDGSGWNARMDAMHAGGPEKGVKGAWFSLIEKYTAQVLLKAWFQVRGKVVQWIDIKVWSS